MTRTPIAYSASAAAASTVSLTNAQTASNPRATYACVNLGEAVAPVEIEPQSILIDAGADDVIAQLCSRAAKRGE